MVAEVKWHPGQLFPDSDSVVTNLTAPGQAVVHFYSGRGTAEQSPTRHSFGDGAWIKEGKDPLHWTRLSCHWFGANQVHLALFVLAYNLGNFLRRL